MRLTMVSGVRALAVTRTLSVWILCLLLVALWTQHTVGSLSERRVAKVDGDILIGALFPVHRQPSLKTAYTRQCGEIWEQYGMHRIEMFLKTLDEINANPEILPNVTLGCDIRDSCWYPPVALSQSIDFIKNSIASRERALMKNSKVSKASTKVNRPIAGLIGPGSSTVTIQVQNLLSLFNIPQIGYSATSKDLSDKSLYQYFLRVVPSDKLQAKALVDLVKYYNWTYISTVYTEGNYGMRGIEEFHKMAEDAGLCTAADEKVENNAGDEAFDSVIDSLQETPNARVVVCFCEGMTVRQLLQASERKGAKGQFLIIGSDGWNVRPDVVEDIEEVSVGGMSLKLYSPEIEEFDKYYFSLDPLRYTRNPWFREFWQQKFKCYLEGPDANPLYTKACTGNEDLSFEYVQDAKLGFVINAIYTMAYALNAMHRDLCGAPGMCDHLDPVNGTLFMEYLLNVSFKSYSNDELHFNQNGDPPGRYEIMNFQRVPTTNGSFEYEYVRIGGWDNGNLSMNSGKIFWPNKLAESGAPVVESVCSKPCPRGEIKVIQDRAHCCWVCNPCGENEFMLDESNCKACPLGWWPNKNLTACLMNDIEFMQWDHKEAIVSIVFACVGIFATLWVTLVFVRHNNTAVVKASTRELSYIILLGIGISYITTFPLVAKPSLVTCYLARILPGCSFSMIYGALVTKTNRIARILAGSKKKIMTRKPRFMSASAQVVITCIVIGVECAIITVMLILEPADSKLVYPTKRKVQLTCNATTMGIIVPLGFDVFLIVMCTLYAIKTRNLPENFNEAKFIGFTMYTTCIIWLAFVPIYFGSDSKVITMCLAITLSASVALILLFFPKIYIIICKPERNNRSAFTTSKEVRCHIGSTGARSLSTDSFDRLELLDPVPSEKEESRIIDNLLGNLGSLSDEDLRLYPTKVKTKSTISLFTSWKTGNLDHQVKGTVHHHAPRMPPSSSELVDENSVNTNATKRKAWHEKSFENAAMAIYRQKNFFSRWRDKSGAQTSTRQKARPGYMGSGNRIGSRGYSSRTASTDDSLCNHGNTQKPNIPNTDSNYKSSAAKKNSPKPDGVPVRRNPSLRSIGFQRRLSAEYVDNAVQTDIELLESFACNLKRRKSSKRSTSSRDNGTNSVLVIEPQDLHSESDNGHLLSRSTIQNDSIPSYSSCLQASEDSQERETDNLLKHSDNYLDLEPPSSSQSYNYMGQSPLLPGSERSPLLGSPGLMCDDTTSEETVSEPGELEDPEDLEELLLGAGEYQGSFSSVASSSNSSARWNPGKRNSDSSARVQVLPDKAYFGYHRPSIEQYQPHRRVSKPSVVPKTYVYSKPVKCTDIDMFDLNNKSRHGSDSSAALPDPSCSADHQGVPHPPVPTTVSTQSNSSSSVPSIMVNKATPQTSDSERFSEITGSNSSFRTDLSGIGSSFGDSGRPLTVTPESRRTSGTGSTSSGDHASSGLSSSAEEFSQCGLTKDDSVTKFQEYLRTRGVDLDLTAVQSSDV